MRQYSRSLDAKVADDVAIICRNTTEAINHLAYRLRLRFDDVVITSVVEHHSNLLPWSRVASRRFVECGADGTFTTADVAAEMDRTPKARLLTLTGASNVTGWIPPVDEIIEAALTVAGFLSLSIAPSWHLTVRSLQRPTLSFGAVTRCMRLSGRAYSSDPAPPSRKETPFWRAVAR